MFLSGKPDVVIQSNEDSEQEVAEVATGEQEVEVAASRKGKY
jgi:hypothetical protein